MPAYSWFGWARPGVTPRRNKGLVYAQAKVTVTGKRRISDDSVIEATNLASAAATSLSIRRVNWPLSCTAVTLVFSSVDGQNIFIKILWRREAA